jgi:hypothetical protein
MCDANARCDSTQCDARDFGTNYTKEFGERPLPGNVGSDAEVQVMAD